MKHYGIYPRNLTARLAYQAAGNPATSRLEDVVGNCFPGLEVDVRNLDRRFFPGLVFNFAGREHRILPAENPKLYGARLTSLEYESDPDLNPADPDVQPLLAEFHGPKGLLLSQGEWFLKTLTQGGKSIEMYETDGDGQRLPLDGMTVWRIVRSLEPGPVTILLERRDAQAADIELHGWRRVYVNPKTGVINEVFQPGELVQSLCSPWQHDFRDCACMYWAANRPDVVFGQLPAGETALPGGKHADPEKATLRLDWLRADRGPSGAAHTGSSYYENRPHQLDPHELNARWTDLSIVLEEHETNGTYTPPAPRTDERKSGGRNDEPPPPHNTASQAEAAPQKAASRCPFHQAAQAVQSGQAAALAPEPKAETARPFASPEELARVIAEQLAPLELALSLEYLYAYFSLRQPEEIDARRWPELREELSVIRRRLLMISISEMSHLRWANQILWEMHRHGLIAEYHPAVTPAARIPRPRQGEHILVGSRPSALRILTPNVLEDFIAVEQPSGFIDGAYARVVATLKQPQYPTNLYQLAVRIDTDGVDHFSRLQEAARILGRYDVPDMPQPYLRDLRLGTQEEARTALELYDGILEGVRQGFASVHAGKYSAAEQEQICARDLMTKLQTEAEALARRGIGVPYYELAAN